MKYSKILLCMTVLVCLAFQACGQSDPLGESASSRKMGSSGDYLSPNMGQGASRANPDEGISGMVQWLDKPVSKDATKSTTIATGSTPGSDAAKSTTAATSAAPSPDSAKSTTTTTSTTPATESTSTTKSTTTTSKTPGFEATFAVVGLLAVTFVTLRKRR
jgi:PGF-CTERM protein